VTRLRIGTRGSQLALWQARAVAHLIEERGRGVALVTITTSGDRLQDAPLSDVGGKRLFVKEIEDALLSDVIDVAVHSAKDMSAVLPEGLTVAAALPRDDPRDAIVLPTGASPPNLQAAFASLGDAPTIGTGSVRRIAQLATLLPDARFCPIRGNVDTRLRKLDAGEYHGLVLASAGMRRLGFASRISAPIPLDVCIPAPGQGIVAIETRQDDRETNALLAALSDPAAAQALEAERALVAALGGGCQLPLGAVALHDGDDLDMHAVAASIDGRRQIRRHARGPARLPSQLGRRLADELVAAGAIELLAEAHGVQPANDNVPRRRS
jgi:hydroxymethylbilane synthase